MRFTYPAEKADGEAYKGVAEAADRFELYDIVRREGGKIVSVGKDQTGNEGKDRSQIHIRSYQVCHP